VEKITQILSIWRLLMEMEREEAVAPQDFSEAVLALLMVKSLG